ncbi:MAG: hypothetical protein M1370_00915 [Bacteroidetes bacterium]|nr:hypothetical protein [Bacteroidota bacterium]MCL5025546.1 hypothetical protein [Chloroflexota bacterium]
MRGAPRLLSLRLQPGYGPLQGRHEVIDLGLVHRRREASQSFLGDDDALVQQIEVQLDNFGYLYL